MWIFIDLALDLVFGELIVIEVYTFRKIILGIVLLDFSVDSKTVLCLSC